MLGERKRSILKSLIEDYLATAEPVGSRHLCRKYHMPLSPATVRNEMSDLEDEGYIMQPHTSAGRIPSDKGYRYYVDHLMERAPLSQKESTLIQGAIDPAECDLESIAHRTLSVASSITRYVTVMLSGNCRLYHYGISNIASHPEFNNVEHLKHIARIFEEETLLTSILEEYSSEGDVTIKIGSENRHRDMKEYSVIVKSCHTGGKRDGALGVIGPTRMFYDKTTSIVEHLSNELKRLYSEEI